jgi:hypothetical protein
LKKGDGSDFCHAVMASAFATAATLDKHWKRRVEGLPKPNQLARIYYQPELDKMVADTRDDQALLALLLALARDPLLRVTGPPVLQMRPGEQLARQQMTDALNRVETHMNSAFRNPARNPDPVASQESTAIRATLEGYHRQTIEVLRPNGPMTQKAIATATGIAGISRGPLLPPVQHPSQQSPT